jgi:hypothetical protein
LSDEDNDLTDSQKKKIRELLDIGTFRITDLKDMLGRTHVEIQSLDPEKVALATKIALEDYQNVGYSHGGFEEQFLGLLEELAVKEALDKLGIDYHYYERKRDYWEGKKREPDLRILPDGQLLEICTTPPRSNYVCGIVKESKLNFNWDYAIIVKIVWIKYDAIIPVGNEWKYVHIDSDRDIYPRDFFTGKDEPIKQVIPSTTPVGEAIIYGYGVRQEIEKRINGWERADNTYPCLYYPCIWKHLEDFQGASSIAKLWEKLKG